MIFEAFSFVSIASALGLILLGKQLSFPSRPLPGSRTLYARGLDPVKQGLTHLGFGIISGGVDLAFDGLHINTFFL